MFARSVARSLPFIAAAFVLVAAERSRSGPADPRLAQTDLPGPEAPKTPAATSAPTPVAPAPQAGPAHVRIGLYATSIPEVDIKAGTFTIDMYLWVVYRGDQTLEAFEIANGETQSKDLLERTTQGDQTYTCWRVKATMHARMSLADYPFDRQGFEIHFESPNFESDALVYEPDYASYERSHVPKAQWGLRADLEIPEYQLVQTQWRVEDSVYATDFGNPFHEKTSSRYSRAIFEIDVARSFWAYCYKILVPLMVIIAIAYLVFFLPPDEIQTASGLAMTSLLTCVAMNLTVSSNLPEIGYLVASDKFFICTYGLIFVTLCETVWTYSLAKRGLLARAEKVERYFRWGFPMGFALAFAFLGYEALS